MSTLYHAHITVHNLGEIPHGWKSTTIVLEGERVQQDIMLTKHYCVGRRGIETPADILADINLLPLNNVLRVKVEQDDGFTLPITPENYVEIHMLCGDGIIPIGEGWVKSRNPRSIKNGIPVYFYNKRVYDSNLSVEEFKASLASEQATVSYLECKVEQVIYDSNRAHDAWWA
jgi:hypothetical protein